MTLAPDAGRRVFRVDRDVYVFPAQPAGVVATAASEGDWMSLIPGRLEPQSRSLMVQRMRDPAHGFDVLWACHVAEQVLASVCGVPWRVMCRLCAVAVEQRLLFDGWCLERGLDPRVLPPARLAAAVHAWLRGQCSEAKEWRRLEAQLWRQPPRPLLEARLGGGEGEAPPSWGDEGALFDQAMAALG